MELPIEDKEGVIMGKMILNDEVDKVLKVTGLSMLFEYNPKTMSVIAYLY